MVVDQDFIASKLETEEYFPVMLTSHKACANSAVICQTGIAYLLSQFPHRFQVYEHTLVSEIRLSSDRPCEVWSGDFALRCSDIVLCTNGFSHFHIVDLGRSDSREREKVFHKNVHGLV